jgi:hypothetical protein
METSTVSLPAIPFKEKTRGKKENDNDMGLDQTVKSKVKFYFLNCYI